MHTSTKSSCFAECLGGSKQMPGYLHGVPWCALFFCQQNHLHPQPHCASFLYEKSWVQGTFQFFFSRITFFISVHFEGLGEKIVFHRHNCEARTGMYQLFKNLTRIPGSKKSKNCAIRQDDTKKSLSALPKPKGVLGSLLPTSQPPQIANVICLEHVCAEMCRDMWEERPPSGQIRPKQNVLFKLKLKTNFWSSKK